MTEVKQTCKKRLTIVMDITFSYEGWVKRTTQCCPFFTNVYQSMRLVCMNDSCGKVDCTCKICEKSIIIHPWVDNAEDLIKQFKTVKCYGGGDIAEKPCCTLKEIIDDYGKSQFDQKDPHDIIMFFDSTGHGCDIVDDSYTATGCTAPSKCNCAGDILFQANRLRELGARICVIAPNRSLIDKQYAIYVAMIAYATRGWVMALPDDEDTMQKSVLGKLDSDYNLSDKFAQLMAKKELVEKKRVVFSNMIQRLKAISLEMEKNESEEKKIADDTYDKELHEFESMAKEEFDVKVIPPGLVFYRNFTHESYLSLMQASKDAQISRNPKALREAITLIGGTVEVAVMNPGSDSKVATEDIGDRCARKYKISVAPKVEKPKVSHPRYALAQRIMTTIETGQYEMVKVCCQ